MDEIELVDIKDEQKVIIQFTEHSVVLIADDGDDLIYVPCASTVDRNEIVEKIRQQMEEENSQVTCLIKGFKIGDEIKGSSLNKRKCLYCCLSIINKLCHFNREGWEYRLGTYFFSTCVLALLAVIIYSAVRY